MTRIILVREGEAAEVQGSLLVNINAREVEDTSEIVEDDRFIAVTNVMKSFVLNLPDAREAKHAVIIKDESGKIGANTVTIRTKVEGQQIDGDLQMALENYGVVTVYPRNGRWFTL